MTLSNERLFTFHAMKGILFPNGSLGVESSSISLYTFCIHVLPQVRMKDFSLYTCFTTSGTCLLRYKCITSDITKVSNFIHFEHTNANSRQSCN
ncbi:hypothetical protein X975_10155, partial [Stegodyphus mimosarum]